MPSLLKSTLMTSAFLLAQHSFAMIPMVPKCNIQPTLENQANLLHRVARIGKEDRRVIPPALQKKFEATGSLGCGGMRNLTAQVTGKGNVITTAGHTFFSKSCEPLGAKGCVFEVTVDGRKKTYKVKPETLKTGKCPRPDRNEDWATLQLEASIDGVTPYDIPESDLFLNEGEQIMQISAHHVNFVVNNKTPKTMEECRIRGVFPGHTIPVQTDCDTGNTSSGSAQFVVRDKKMIFAAMNVAEVRGSDGKLTDGTEFDDQNFFNISVPVSGEFLRSIKEQMR